MSLKPGPESLSPSRNSKLLDAPSSSSVHPTPHATLKRNWALSEEQRREEHPHPFNPTSPPRTLFLTPCGVLLKHSPPLSLSLFPKARVS